MEGGWVDFEKIRFQIKHNRGWTKFAWCLLKNLFQQLDSVFQQKIHSLLSFIREFSNHTHTQLFY